MMEPRKPNLMNTSRSRFLTRLLLVAGLLAGAGLALENACPAAAFGKTTVFPSYWSVTHLTPPLPYHPFPGLPTVEVEPGVFVYDDTMVDYQTLWEESAALVTFEPPSTMSMTAEEQYGCGLWLEIGLLTNSAVLVTLHNTFAGKGYQLWTKTQGRRT